MTLGTEMLRALREQEQGWPERFLRLTEGLTQEEIDTLVSLAKHEEETERGLAHGDALVWTDDDIRAAGYDPDELRRNDAARDALYGDLGIGRSRFLR